MTQLKRLIVIDIVGLTPSMLGTYTPHLNALIQDGLMVPMQGGFPAVTTTAQATMLTGTTAKQHGIVGNGWYLRDQAEVRFWLQANSLMQGDKIWHSLKQANSDFTCSQLFWWYNMYAGVDNAMTPRPHYPADGRKVMGLYSEPATLQAQIEQQIGAFPFFNFWGPAADIRSSRWIVDCAIAEHKMNQPDLQLVYLPHLDYNLQRLGPDDPAIDEDIAAIDHEAGRLIDFGRSQGAEILVVSEYGVSPVSHSISLNRILRQAGLLAVRNSLTWELLDSGASRAFAVADHQIAHIYIKAPNDILRVKTILEKVPGVERVLDRAAQSDYQINHARSGELIAIAEPDSWFNYYYWFDDDKAPDFARTVDIHRKPGYDPVELFIDPALRFPQWHIAKRLLQKKMGQRMLMDVIPLTPELVKGSHGRLSTNADEGPVIISSSSVLSDLLYQTKTFDITQVNQLISMHFKQALRKVI
ncbi:alkaline phosphatase family protein [Shewanella surugensis]|uniref:Alkaline phosphatase family protein n=1 Tax=Shewanella surugensis TaxID=212020 RepID=A0ABT0LGS0_9GAMM|nr:nucleotide pyrophosphatase/phosphodiesterase family protein [Shewanella surugensis]MCL1126901.1 alkaline phosphatase family protein [Shewanella surugensis]